MSGGGSSGSIDLPLYMENTHRQWLGQGDKNESDASYEIVNNIAALLDRYTQDDFNPYNALDYKDPEPFFDVSEEKINDFDAFISQLDEKEDWKGITLRALQTLDDDVIKNLDTESIISGGFTDSGSQQLPFFMRSKINTVVADLIPENFANRLSESFTKIDDLDSQHDWRDLLDSVVQRADTPDVLKDVDITSMIEQQIEQTDAPIDAAIAKAVDLINDQVIIQLIEGQNQDIDEELSRQNAQFKANMDGVSAVQTSSFAFGLALLRETAIKRKGQYSAETRSRVYELGYSGYVDMYKANLTSYLQAALANKQARDTFVSQNMQNIVRMLYDNVQFKQTLTQFLGELKVNYSASAMQNIMQYFITQMSETLRVKAQENRSRDQLLDSSIKNMSSMLMNKAQYEQGVASLVTEHQRMRYASNREFEMGLTDKEDRRGRWPFEVYQAAANVLAAPSGASTFVPKGNSQLSSALGGALGGAAAGAPLGAPGMIAGGAIGGLAGLLE